MMIHAYQEMYLSKAQGLLGEAFDYAINDCDVSGEAFIKLFISSSAKKRIEMGDPSLIEGMSGIELVQDILLETKCNQFIKTPKNHYERSEEYWIGWAIAAYQWYSDRQFNEIFQAFSFDDLASMYTVLHEADISKFIEIADKHVKETFKETNLKRIRKLYGISQSRLSAQSGVKLRSIQMYEQRNKDINKASAETLYRFSKILGCTMEDLLEKTV